MSHVIGAIFLTLIGTVGLVIGLMDFRDPTRMRRSWWTKHTYAWASDCALKAIATLTLALFFFLFVAALGFAIAELREI